MLELLKKYGHHLKDCELVRQPHLSSTDSHWVCTCGFSKAVGCRTCGETGYLDSVKLGNGFYTGVCPECGSL